MSHRVTVPLCTAILVLAGLAAVPALAESPTQGSGCQSALAVPTADVGFLYQAARGSNRGGDDIGGPGAQSTCIADCQDGSTVTCTGSSCTATDASCPSERGSCWGTDTGTRYCPVCTCSATATCAHASPVSCTGTGDSCFAIDGCYASCNGNLTWCPNPKGPCPIESGS